MSDLRKIMYVEDEPDIQAIAELSLQTIGGFEVTLCNSGEDAIAKVADCAPDLILLDVMMPGMDGPETLVQLRATGAVDNTPIVFLTAKTAPEDREHLISLGAAGVIAKPFDPMNLPDQVREVWTAAKG